MYLQWPYVRAPIFFGKCLMRLCSSVFSRMFFAAGRRVCGVCVGMKANLRVPGQGDAPEAAKPGVANEPVWVAGKSPAPWWRMEVPGEGTAGM